MPLDLTPDTHQLRAIMEAQVTGAYRFVHHALIPYVRIGPAVPDEPVIIQAGTTVRLVHGDSLTLQGLQDTKDFAIAFVGQGIQLVEVDCLPQYRRHLAQKALDGIGSTWVDETS